MVFTPLADWKVWLLSIGMFEERSRLFPSTPVDATEAELDRSFGSVIGCQKIAHSTTATNCFADVTLSYQEDKDCI